MMGQNEKHKASEIFSSLAVIGVGNIVERGGWFLFFNASAVQLSLADADILVRLLYFVSAYASIMHLSIGIYIARTIVHAGADHDEIISYYRIGTAVIIGGSFLVSYFALYSVKREFGGILNVEFAVTCVASLSFGVIDLMRSIMWGTGRGRQLLAIQIVGSLLLLITYSLSIYVALPATLMIALIPASSAFGYGITLFASTSWRPLAPFTWESFFKAVRFSGPLALSSVLVNPVILAVINYAPSLDTEDRLTLTLALNWLGLCMAVPGMLSTASLHLILKSSTDEKQMVGWLYAINLGFSMLSIVGVYIYLLFFGASLNALDPQFHFIVLLISFSAVPVSAFQITANRSIKAGFVMASLYANIIFALSVCFVALTLLDFGLGVFSVAFAVPFAHFLRFVCVYLALLFNHRVRSSNEA